MQIEQILHCIKIETMSQNVESPAYRYSDLVQPCAYHQVQRIIIVFLLKFGDIRKVSLCENSHYQRQDRSSYVGQENLHQTHPSTIAGVLASNSIQSLKYISICKVCTPSCAPKI